VQTVTHREPAQADRLNELSLSRKPATWTQGSTLDKAANISDDTLWAILTRSRREAGRA